MTVTYTHEVTDCKGFGNFWRLLFRWRGSVYKLVWMDLLAYIIIYFSLSLVYRLVLTEEQRRLFEKVALTCNHFSDFIPVSFVLGFYVSIVIKRWWDQYQTLLWPDSLALFVSTCIHGHDRQGRLMRRTILRYVNLSFVLTLTMITPRAKKRFPTLEHIVEAGFMTDNERKVFLSMVDQTPHFLCYVPLVWAGTLLSRARKEGRVRDDFAVKTILDELNNLRVKINALITYDWISIPLVYTQVVSLAVYTFFLSTIMGRQFLDPQQHYPKNDIDFYFPFFTVLQFFFYMGWLKVAESLVNPFGEDDDDFEVNWIIDRNIQVSYLIVDEMHNEHPQLTQDLYWDEVFPQELPYTVAAEHCRRHPPQGSTANIQVPQAQQEFLPLLEEEMEEKGEAQGDVEREGEAPRVRRRDSARSCGSSVSGRKSSLISMLHNRLRRGEHRGSGASHISVRRNQHVRSVSQSGSHFSDVSLPSSLARHMNTNPSLHESEIIHINEENTEAEGRRQEAHPVPIYFLSSSPILPHRKVTINPSTTTTTTTATTSPTTTTATDVDPIVMKVSRLQVNVDEEEASGQDRETAAAAPGTTATKTGAAGGGGGEGESPHDMDSTSTTSTFTSVFESQVDEEYLREMEREMEGEMCCSSTRSSCGPDPEEAEHSRSEAAEQCSGAGGEGSVAADGVKGDDLPVGTPVEGNSQYKSWYEETWQL